jgi:HlyD family secretion protein
MDFIRSSGARNRRLRRAACAVVGIGALLLTTLGISRLRPAPPSAERTTLVVDAVKRGTMLRQVRGPGSLVPLEITWISAATEGRVVRKLIEPGAETLAATVLLELSNPELGSAALDAEWACKSAEAELEATRVRVDNQLLELEPRRRHPFVRPNFRRTLIGAWSKVTQSHP